MRPGGRWVRSGSSSSSGCALGVAGYVQLRRLRQGERWFSLTSFWFVLFVRLLPGVVGFVRVCLGAAYPLQGAFGFDWFAGLIWDRLVRPGAPFGFVQVCLDRTDAPCGSLGSFGFVRVRLGGRWVHFGSSGSHHVGR